MKENEQGDWEFISQQCLEKAIKNNNRTATWNAILLFSYPWNYGRLKTLLQKCHEKLCWIFGYKFWGLIDGSADLYSRDLSFDIQCAYRLTSGSLWNYTVSEDKCFLSDSFHSNSLSISTVTGCLTAPLCQSLLVLRKQAELCHEVLLFCWPCISV